VQRGSGINFPASELTGTLLQHGSPQSPVTISTVSLFTKPRFSRRLMEADALSMKNLYIRTDFSRQKWKARWDRPTEKGRRFDRSLNIEEGNSARLQPASGSMHALTERRFAGFGALPGQPFRTSTFRAIAITFWPSITNQGFPDATFSYTAEPDNPRKRKLPSPKRTRREKLTGEARKFAIERAEPVKLVYKIVEGQRISVKNIFSLDTITHASA